MISIFGGQRSYHDHDRGAEESEVNILSMTLGKDLKGKG